MYKPKDNHTPPLFPEIFPLGGALNPHNRWLQLAALVPWEKLEEVYAGYFSENGRPAKDSRLVCGLLIVKWLEDCSDSKTVELFNESPYIQAFCGFENFVTEENVADSSIFSRARNRLGQDVFTKFENQIIRLVKEHSSLKSKFPGINDRRKTFGGKVLRFFVWLSSKIFGETR